jgi:hypothetical protein
MAEIIDERQGKPIEYEGGSVVMTRGSVTDESLHEFEGEQLTPRQIMSRINEGAGGLSFAEGGEMPDNILTTGKEYSFDGTSMSDEAIVKTCGCKHAKPTGNSSLYEQYKKGALLTRPEMSRQEFKKSYPELYKVEGKYMLAVVIGQGYETYWSEQSTAAEAMDDIYQQYAETYRMGKGGQMFVFFTDQFDIKKAYDLLHSGEINYEVREIDTQASRPSSFNRFNQDYAENLEDDIDWENAQGIMIKLPATEGMPARDILIDGNHRSHYAYKHGIKKMKVYYISNPKTIKKFQRTTNKELSLFAVGGQVHTYGTLTFTEFFRKYGKFVYREPNAEGKQEWTVALPTTYGHKVFTSLAPTFRAGLKELYEEYLVEKDRYAVGGQIGKDYQYALTIRPFGIGTYPSDHFERYEASPVYKFGILHYSEKLPIEECLHFDLCPITELEELEGKTIKWFDDYEGTIQLNKEPETGKINSVTVQVKVGEEIIPERLAYNKFLQKYYQGKWGTAYEQGGELIEDDNLYLDIESAEDYLRSNPEHILFIVDYHSNLCMVQYNEGLKMFVPSSAHKSERRFRKVMLASANLREVLSKIKNEIKAEKGKKFLSIYYTNKKGEAVQYFDDIVI